MTYDCLIVGGGPAGLSAAIYLARFLRSTLVLDSAGGRSSSEQVNDNYLGFPNGVKGTELRALGKQQAERFGAGFQICDVQALSREKNGIFQAQSDQGSFEGRTVILCTGVCDLWPHFPNVQDFVGKSLFWCITCDGFRAKGKRVIAFGADDEAVTTVLQLLRYTNDIVLIHRSKQLDCSEEKVRALEESGIRLICGDEQDIEGLPGEPVCVILEDWRRFACDILFGLLGCVPNNKLAVDVGVACSPKGYVLVNEEGYTSVPGLFAAGDLSRMHTHQVVSAAHEGAESAQTANYFLYDESQRNTDIKVKAPDLGESKAG